MKQFLGFLTLCIALLCVVAGCGSHKAQEECPFDAVVQMQDTRIANLEREVAALTLRECGPGCHCGDKQADDDFEAQVLDLPDDANTWHTCLFVNANYASARTDLGASERRAVAMFQSHPTLMSLKAQTHFHLITVGSPEFRKFAGVVDALPCLLIERSDGEVMYRESGPSLGKNPAGLVKSVRKEIGRHCPDGHCIPIHPTPNQPAVPDAVPTAVVEPSAPDAPVAKSGVGIAVAMTFVACLCGVALKFKQATG